MRRFGRALVEFQFFARLFFHVDILLYMVLFHGVSLLFVAFVDSVVFAYFGAYSTGFRDFFGCYFGGVRGFAAVFLGFPAFWWMLVGFGACSGFFVGFLWVSPCVSRIFECLREIPFFCVFR